VVRRTQNVGKAAQKGKSDIFTEKSSQSVHINGAAGRPVGLAAEVVELHQHTQNPAGD
jgi:hypothetical protein